MFYRRKEGHAVKVSEVVAEVVDVSEINKIREHYIKTLLSYGLNVNDLGHFNTMVIGNKIISAGEVHNRLGGKFIAIEEYHKIIKLYREESGRLIEGFYYYNATSISELSEKILPIFNELIKRYKLGPKTKDLALQFIGTEHREKKLKENLKDSVGQMISHAATYVGNGIGKDPERY